MNPYARMFLHFLHAITNDRDRVYCFTFGTRLNNISRALRNKDVDIALQKASAQVEDWSGGTRIGAALKSFIDTHGRRGLARGAVVVIVSDGWDRGDPVQLGREMARLHRTCFRLYWLNPLLGSPNYKPLTRGMQAALPHLDDFLPAHSLASMTELLDRLADLPLRRSGFEGASKPRSCDC